ncbi:MAG: hypothetical protein HP496_14645 [Nitrospira sp.]|nr:hypothetical protein [Nitrospira sp.]
MKSTRIVIACCVLMLNALIGWGQEAALASEETELQGVRQQLDTDTAARSSNRHAETLAKQFKVEVGTVEQLRASKQGWGEIAIRMGLAQELVKTDPKTYPTMTEALQKVGDLRAQGSGWGAIAKDLGFKLGPVVSEMRHVRNEMRAEMRNADLDRGSKVSKREVAHERLQIERENKGDRMERAERMERQERMEKAERPERPERPDRPERPEKPERSGRN